MGVESAAEIFGVVAEALKGHAMKRSVHDLETNGRPRRESEEAREARLPYGIIPEGPVQTLLTDSRRVG